MSRRLWVAAAVLLPLLVVAIPTLAIVAIWTNSGRLGGIAFVLLLTAIPAVPGFWIWTDECKPARNLPRRDRKRLRAEAARVRLDAEIAQLEKEVGLR